MDTTATQPQAGQAPVPGAAPAPAPRPLAAQPAPRDPSARAAELHAELEAIRRGTAPGPVTMLRVLPPHGTFTHAGVTVGRDPGPVPAHALAPLMAAAAAAHVTIEEA